MAFLLLDNYDSFTFNLYHSLAKVTGEPPIVVRNDDAAGLAQLRRPDVRGVIISPGPGHPATTRDFGLSCSVVHQATVPVLGVCLGHQGLCLAAGARIDLAPEPFHGRTSVVRHNGDQLFAGIPERFEAMRYHSLLAYDLPEELTPIATTDDGLLMAVRHRTKPQWGVQFHPESIATEHGDRLVENFVRLCAPDTTVRTARAATRPDRAAGPATGRYRVVAREIHHVTDVDAAFATLFGADESAFWLDSAQVVAGLSRFSLLGSAGGPLGERVVYDVGADRTDVFGADGLLREQSDGAVLGYLGGKLAQRRVPATGLPIEFALGYVGYLGYELKASVGAADVHRSPTPDAQLVFADRSMVVDHEQRRTWLLALTTDDVDGGYWLDDAESALRGIGPLPAEPAADSWQEPEIRARHTDEEYLALIAESQRLIHIGESYEICLTNMLDVDCVVDPWHTYRRLRALNPAPFGALLRFPGLNVLSSSPERFLRMGTDRIIESKPIKGTSRRGTSLTEDRRLAEELAASEKERAENIMIVDLVRNDIGRAAEIGSVHVPVLCGVESYRSVHQLVSTVRGTVQTGVTGPEAVAHAFPGGSMTGAPKLRTMEIIDELEGGPRGVYSGAIGYFSLDGAMDLSITIRTVVIAGDSVSIGVGGAITALSDPAAEVREMWLKAKALLATIGQEIGAHQGDPLPVGAGS